MGIVICILFVFFIIWRTCIPSGKPFLRQTEKDYKKIELIESEIISFGKSVIPNSNFNMLMSKFKSLTTFAEVNKWDKEAELELVKIFTQKQKLDHQISQLKQILSQSKIQQFLFHSRLQSVHDKYKVPLKNMEYELQEAIDFTPNSLVEKKELLKELKSKKKELQLRKREVAADMKAIRRKARTESANAGRGLIFGYDSKLAAHERRGIRYSKEAQLRPHEDAMTAIERQLLQIDKDIFWVESFED